MSDQTVRYQQTLTSQKISKIQKSQMKKKASDYAFILTIKTAVSK